MVDNQHLSESEAFDLHATQLRGRNLAFAERVREGGLRADHIADPAQPIMLRQIIRADGREVEMVDRLTGQPRRFLMFGSNDYLGFSTHPYVRQKVHEALDAYGAGTPGPPLLNGYTHLHRELEERLAALKGAEDVILFPTGYSANVGLISSLLTDVDSVVFDQLAHASFWDGLRMAGVRSHRRFRHNDAEDLDVVLQEECRARDRFVVVDGVYSMDGDAAPLERIVPICRKRGAVLIVDDAHATGVLGASGRGTAEHCGVEGQVDVTVATLGKAFGVIGAFTAASRDLIKFLRFFARSHIFSTSLPPIVVAAVLAGLDLLERDPGRVAHLRAMVRRAADGLRKFGLVCEPVAGIIALRAPPDMGVRKAAAVFERMGLFMNYVMFPAVPVHQQRFRISVSACHTPEDIDRLVAAVEEVWATCRAPEPLAEAAGELGAAPQQS